MKFVYFTIWLKHYYNKLIIKLISYAMEFYMKFYARYN